jgi:lysophospholipase L1-like esterase
MKRLAASLVLVGASTLAALLGFELLLRAIGYSAPIWNEADPQLGWRLRPGVQAHYTGEGDAFVSINAAGWRDRDHALEKPAGVYRIAVLGDSYSEARQVPVEKAYWALLPQELERCGFQSGKRIESLNFGVSGYGTAQEYLVLEARAGRYRPDLVLLQFTNGNDVRNNSRELEPEAQRPYFRLEVGKNTGNQLRLDDSFASSGDFARRTSGTSVLARSLTDHSRLLQMLRTLRERGAAPRPAAATAAVAGAEQGLDPRVLKAPEDAQWERAWQLTEALIAGTRDLALKQGAGFLLVTVPYAIQVHPSAEARASFQRTLGAPDLFYPDRRLAQFAARHGIAAVPLAPAMQHLADETGVFFHGFPASGMGQGHWNELGHRVAAQLIAQRLCAGEGEGPPARVLSAGR